jgi:hypothetical protein
MPQVTHCLWFTSALFQVAAGPWPVALTFPQVILHFG